MRDCGNLVLVSAGVVYYMISLTTYLFSPQKDYSKLKTNFAYYASELLNLAPTADPPYFC